MWCMHFPLQVESTTIIHIHTFINLSPYIMYAEYCVASLPI